MISLLHQYTIHIPWFSDSFPMVFQLLIVFPRLFHGFPMVFPTFDAFPMLLPGFSQPLTVFRGAFAPVPSSSARRNRWAASAPRAQRPPRWHLP